MRILVIELKIYLSWSMSLKDKRQEKRKICDRLKNRFNCSVIEQADQDILNSLSLGISCCCLSDRTAEELKESIYKSIVSWTDGEMYEFYTELL